MRIGIFGGSFNPPHNMHLQIAKTLLEKDVVDHIIFVPTGNHYSYKKNMESDKHRLHMLEIIANKNDNISVSDYELQDHAIYTCETLSYFQNIHPNDTLYFICGADNLSYIDTWKEGKYILSHYKILVMERENYDIKQLFEKYKKYQQNIILAPIPSFDLSSTKIRELLKQKDEAAKKDLDKDVYQYIIEKNLYQE